MCTNVISLQVEFCVAMPRRASVASESRCRNPSHYEGYFLYRTLRDWLTWFSVLSLSVRIMGRSWVDGCLHDRGRRYIGGGREQFVRGRDEGGGVACTFRLCMLVG